MKKIHFKTINSTNTYLKENYKDLPNFTCVSSAHQSQGHGRYNRNWESNNNENLTFSILIKNKKLIEKFSSISLAIATCILKLLTSYKIRNISIKWPNDVYVIDKKICGILLEGIANECLIIGVGLNVNQTNFSKEIEDKTTSIINIKNKKTSIFLLKNKLYKLIYKELNKIEFDDKSYLEIVRNNNYLKDKEVFASINNKQELVKVVDVNEDNSLKILLHEEIINIFSGEITFHKD